MKQKLFNIYSFYRELIIENRKWIIFIVGWAVIWLLAGMIVALFFPDISKTIYDGVMAIFAGFMDKKPVINLQSVLQLFKQNLQSNLLVLFLGIILGIMPLFSIAVNFFIIGFISIYLRQSFLFMLLGLIPHGIFEFPSLILASAFGLRLGLFWTVGKEKKLKISQRFLLCLKQNAQLVPLIVVLLALAGVIEVYVTLPILVFLKLMAV